MTAPLTTPEVNTLREFLLGALPPERAEQVAAWLARDPSAVQTLHRLAADDPLTQTLAATETAERIPAPAAERLIRSTLATLGIADTPLPAAPTTAPGPASEPATES